MEALDSQETAFLTKIYQFVDDPNTDHIVSWGKDGSSFVVRRPLEFSRYFVPNDSPSRLLNLFGLLDIYGFRNIGPDRRELANEYFKKGEKHLLCEIHRRKTIQPQVELNHHHQSFSPYRYSARDSTSPPDSDHEHQLNNNWSTTVPDVYHLRPSRSGTELESSISWGPEVSDAVPPLFFNPTKEVKSNATPEVSDTIEVMNISPELENLLGIHTSQLIEKFHAKLTRVHIYDISLLKRLNLEKFIKIQFFEKARVFDGIKRYDGVTENEFSKLFSRYEEFLLKDCMIKFQKWNVCPIRLNLKTEFPPEVSTDSILNAEFDHEFDGDSTQYQKRAGSTRYRSIQSLADRFLEENINSIGDDQVKLDLYGMPRLQAFITLKFFQMAKESGLMLVMDSTNTSNMFKHFEEPLLRDCIQEIQKGPIQTDLFKTFAYTVDERLDRIKRMKMSLDGAKQGAAVVVGHVLSSSRSGVVIYVMIFALFMGISFSMLAHLLRKHKSVSKVLTKLGIMGTASSVILSFAALIPKVMLSCTFGTIAILLLAFMLMMN